MIKRTLLFSSPYKLALKNGQLLMSTKEAPDIINSIPIEDLGAVVFEDQQISFTIPLLNELVKNNVATIFCDQQFMPTSMLLTLDGNNVQGEVFRKQIGVSEALKKSLWKQTIEAKIGNQIALLNKLKRDGDLLKSYQKNVKSGDSDNREGAAARVYWKELFGKDFIRDRDKDGINALLNYSYTILRAAIARGLSGSGLLPTLGIFHKNRYNAFPLADDIMEPFRPFADEIVYTITLSKDLEINKKNKAKILELLFRDVYFKSTSRPLMVGISQTTASLARCFGGELRRVDYPMLL